MLLTSTNRVVPIKLKQFKLKWRNLLLFCFNEKSKPDYVETKHLGAEGRPTKDTHMALSTRIELEPHWWKTSAPQQSYFLYYNMTKLELRRIQLLIFFQNIIRDSKVIQGEMAHQLYVYQSLSFSPLVDMVNMRGNASNQVRYRIVVSLTESKGICCGCSGPCYQANFTVLLIQGSN